MTTILNRHIRAKKSLGQNFLKSKSVLSAIIKAGEVTKNDTILEIGPGKGALTEKLLETEAQVIAIEKDSTLIPVLQETFEKEIKSKQLLLHEGDVLQTTPKKLKIKQPYKLIANIPYYITGEIIRFFLEEKDKPSEMVLLVQKEVGQRIATKDGKESILSLSVKAYGTPKYIQTVSKKYFSPSPKVDSAVISIKHISSDNFKHKTDEELFFKTIKTAFKSKRKKVLSNLTPLYSKETLESFFKTNNLDTNTRAENIQIETWFKLIKLYKEK